MLQTTDEPRALSARTLRRATAKFVEHLAPWRCFCTLTFARPVSDAIGHDAFRRWSRYLAKDLYRAHVQIAWAHGPQARGVIHFHALVAPVELTAAPVELAELAAAWRGGPDVDVRPVHNAEGVADYVSRHPSWDANVACDRRPPCRRSCGCLLAPGPWHRSGSLST